MARIMLVVLALAITIYAISDWVSRSRTWTPGRVNRWVWLAVIVLIPIIGPLAWIIVGLVTRAEQRRVNTSPDSTPPRSSRPDDNPEALSDLADRISRRQHRSRPVRRPNDSPQMPPSDEDDDTNQTGDEDEEDA
ncbi:MAG: PLDc_N domain-containing protein [Actinomyces sp.]|jgi:type VI protein secretion system component VasK|uniref:PLD nuclease N-terminal domain-containing protein n=1 Tax=Schaalia sp. JY-X159 TaxID=2758575 RepID=UPI00165D9D41|nr:PLD nuclease N-terminal domain-containing protein [Schaalia sp. JY-X159]MBP7880879.1 PLDc_N domain-containing protein [Actinomyces sp.]